MKKRVKYWIELSEYDLETAKKMLETGRYLYVGFMCHQTIEKALKSYWQSIKNKLPPKTHKLTFLASETNFINKLSKKHIDLLFELEPLNIQTRYPEYKDAILKKLRPTYCRKILNKTEELYKCIKEML